jgi:hypothetical protein
MALNNKIEKGMDGFTGSVTALDCYIRVDRVSGNKEAMIAEVVFLRGGKNIDSINYSFVPDMAAGNAIEQAYTHLKTLPEFTGATDV